MFNYNIAMDKEIIMEQLRKIVESRGGKYKSKFQEKLGDVDKKYKNEYEDDGSIEYEKLRVSVLKKIANYLFGAEGLKEIKAVPEDVLEKVMKQLKLSRQYDIDELIRKQKDDMKALDILEKDKDLIKYRARLKKAEDDGLGKTLKKLKYPELEKYESEFKTTETLPERISEATSKKIAELFGSGMSGGKKKRKQNISDAERKRRSDRMKAMHAKKK